MTDPPLVVKVASGHAWKPLALASPEADREKVVARLKELHPWAINGSFIFVAEDAPAGLEEVII